MFKSWSFGARRIQSQLVVWTALILVMTVVVISEIRSRSSVRLLEDYLQDRAESEVQTVGTALNLAHTRGGGTSNSCCRSETARICSGRSDAGSHGHIAIA